MLIVHGANASPFVGRMRALLAPDSSYVGTVFGRPSREEVAEEERARFG